MDLTPPTRHPCTCDELHLSKQRANSSPKKLNTLVGRLSKGPIKDIKYYVWHDCPRHGGYEFGAHYPELKRKLGERFFNDHRGDLQQDRTWMFDPDAFQRNAYRWGAEPPWEPTYVHKDPAGTMVTRVDYIPIKPKTEFPRRSRIKKSLDLTPKFSIPEPDDPITPLPDSNNMFGIQRSDAHLHP